MTRYPGWRCVVCVGSAILGLIFFKKNYSDKNSRDLKMLRALRVTSFLSFSLRFLKKVTILGSVGVVL